LRKAKLKVKTSKCKIGFKETKFLGFIIDEHGIRADAGKTAPIKDYPRPKTPKAIRRFLGLVSYYQKFIQRAAELT
jgi:hypothetical protein